MQLPQTIESLLRVHSHPVPVGLVEPRVGEEAHCHLMHVLVGLGCSPEVTLARVQWSLRLLGSDVTLGDGEAVQCVHERVRPRFDERVATLAGNQIGLSAQVQYLAAHVSAAPQHFRPVVRVCAVPGTGNLARTVSSVTVVFDVDETFEPPELRFRAAGYPLGEPLVRGQAGTV